MTNPEDSYVKVHFRLEIEDDWPQPRWRAPPGADLAKGQRLLNHAVAEEWRAMEEGGITAQWWAASVG
ncbi:hypothetical protein [Streptomyces sp. bgisy100]|uniref:hypothetical protein n=1 Tax=Streptomyces sp. bgisy100 TaxID=3413783 RepID=UPI003D703BDA